MIAAGKMDYESYLRITGDGRLCVGDTLVCSRCAHEARLCSATLARLAEQLPFDQRSERPYLTQKDFEKLSCSACRGRTVRVVRPAQPPVEQAPADDGSDLGEIGVPDVRLAIANGSDPVGLVGADFDDGSTARDWRITNADRDTISALDGQREMKWRLSHLSSDGYFRVSESCDPIAWIAIAEAATKAQASRGEDLASLRLLRTYGITPKELASSDRARFLVDVLQQTSSGVTPDIETAWKVYQMLRGLSLFEQGVRIANRWLHIAEKSGDEDALSYRFMSAVLLRDAGRPNEALEASAFLERRGAVQQWTSGMVSSAWTNRGASFADIGDYVSAKRCADRAWAAAKSEHVSSLYERIKAARA